MTFDQMRTAFPHLSFCVYGLERLPDGQPGPVTLEALLPDGTAVQEQAWTLQAAVDKMFPEEAAPTMTAESLPTSSTPPTPRKPSLFD
jgi:hypothetical protein